MRKASLRWAPEAKRNLKSIQQYIGRNAPRTAAAFVKRLVEAVEVLRDFPEIGATVLTLVSDNNFSAIQRTLLLQFGLVE